jgi:hypothetical protein
MAKKKKVKPVYIWCIAYIDPEHLERTSKDLGKFEDYADITAFIPTVKILKKTFKNKNEFEEVPLLFNYGFFKIPRHLARNPEFFVKMKERLPVIYHWVKDPAKALALKPRFQASGETKKSYLDIAVATDKEIEILVQTKSDISIYDKDDLKDLKEGTIITLKGYPWEDMQARIISIDVKKEQVKVELMVSDLMKEVTVSFHNVFYTIYRGGHKVDGIREKSIEDLKGKSSGITDSISIDL